jgi:hypothetical protein
LGQAQNNLSTTLVTIGGRERRTARLKEAVAAFRERPQGKNPRARAAPMGRDQNNLGNALATLGERESGSTAGGGGSRLSLRTNPT